MKRGLSSIVVSVILVLIVISAVSIVWTFLRPNLTSSSQEFKTSFFGFAGSFSIQDAAINQETGEYYVDVLRNAGGSDYEVIGVYIITENEQGEIEADRYDFPFNELESRVLFGQSSLELPIVKISLAPILIVGAKEEIGEVIESYIVSGNEDISFSDLSEEDLILNDEDGLPFYLKYQCANDVDDDGDGFADYPEDPECQYANQTKENAPYIGRKLYTTQDKDYYVCASGPPTCDYKTIQEAVNDIPIFVLHKHYINIYPGVYNEHVRVPMFYGNLVSRIGAKERVPARINSLGFNLYSVNVSSVTVGSVSGYLPFQVSSVVITNQTPYHNRAGIEIYNSGEVTVNYVSFAKDVKNGVLCSSSRCLSDWVRFYSGNNVEYAFISEKNSTFSSWMEANISVAPYSQIPGYLHKAQDSLVIHDIISPFNNSVEIININYNVTALSGLYDLDNSIFLDDENNTGYGFNNLGSATSFLTNHIVNGDRSRNYLIENIDDYLEPYIQSNNLVLPEDNRPLVSSETRNVSICNSGCDYNKIQDALNTVPLILKHDYTFNIRNGNYNEDLLLPMYLAYDSKVSIIGNSSNPSNVTIGSILVDTARGRKGQESLLLEGFKTTRNGPYADEDTTLWVFGSSNVVLKNLILTNKNVSEPTGEGMLCYSSICNLYNINFGDNVETWSAVHNKHTGIVVEHTPSSGFIGARGYTGGHGFMLVKTNVSQLDAFYKSNYPIGYYSDNKGFTIDTERGLSYGIKFS